MRLSGKKIGILIESDFFENEIFYYEFRFAEEGAEVHFLSRLWGNPSITFQGHELRAPFTCTESFEQVSDAELATYDCIIVPSGMVSDRLRYTPDVNQIPPATEFLRRAFANPQILKGIICHGLWLTAPATELVRGRRLVCHNNLHGDAIAYGANYVDQDVVVDGDLVTARTGKHCHLFAKQIVELLSHGNEAARLEQLLESAR
jgi:protease I